MNRLNPNNLTVSDLGPQQPHQPDRLPTSYDLYVIPAAIHPARATGVGSQPIHRIHRAAHKTPDVRTDVGHDMD